MATDPTPPPIEFTTVMLGVGFLGAMAKVCGLCCALVPLALDPVPEGQIAPEEVHRRFHAALFEAVTGAYPAEVIAGEMGRLRRARGDG